MRTPQLSEDSSSSQSDFEHVDMVVTEGKAGSLAHRAIRVEIVLQFDSRATVNVLTAKHVHERNPKHSDMTLIMWNGTEMKLPASAV